MERSLDDNKRSSDELRVSPPLLKCLEMLKSRQEDVKVRHAERYTAVRSKESLPVALRSFLLTIPQGLRTRWNNTPSAWNPQSSRSSSRQQRVTPHQLRHSTYHTLTTSASIMNAIAFITSTASGLRPSPHSPKISLAFTLSLVFPMRRLIDLSSNSELKIPRNWD